MMDWIAWSRGGNAGIDCLTTVPPPLAPARRDPFCPSPPAKPVAGN
ncbi:MAG: hypothetical protein ACTSUE_06575 [Promethearchaeota archaeon]